MPGHPVLQVTCACGHRATIPARREWNGLLRDALLARLKCSKCGGRPVDVKRGWDVPSWLPTSWG